MITRLNINGFSVDAEFPDEGIEKVIRPLMQRIEALKTPDKKRAVVFLAAPPGAGKSTLGKFMETLSGGQLQCVSIDGFHYANAELKEMTVETEAGPVSAVKVKGAPETYDVTALKACLKAAKEEDSVLFPVYDRTLHEPVKDAFKVESPVLLLEGNWLLSTEGSWPELSSFADLTIFMDAEEEALKEGLVRRKMRGGLSLSDAKAWFETTDGPNIRRVKEKRRTADITIQSFVRPAGQIRHNLP